MDAPIPGAVIQSGLQQPTMWITRDAETMRLERRRAGGWSEADIQIPYWSPLLSRLGIIGPIDRRRAHDIINAFSVAFFDRYLKGRPATLLDGAARAYPEVVLEARRPHRVTP